MLALRWHARGDVRLDEVDPPGPPAPHEVQIAVTWCGICGTDVEELRHGPVFIPVDGPHPLTGRQAPLTLGHEVSGVVVAVGSAVSSLRLGDRVGVDGLIFCGTCPSCRVHRVNICTQLGAVGLMADGGLAERCNVPAVTCFVLPPTIPDEAGALAETLSVTVRALSRGRLSAGERVVVVGGGPVGLLAAAAARARGAGRVTVVEPMAARRQVALAIGADEALAPGDTDGLVGDVVLECTGSPPVIDAALSLTAPAGRLVLVGIYSEDVTVSPLALVLGEREIIGTLAHVYDEDYLTAIELLASGRIDVLPVISDRVPLARSLDDGLHALAERPAEHLKILVHPH